jgi:1,5-anhydro-D-fructose reductase (1,5-anhydro-D-mannitol-forming)
MGVRWGIAGFGWVARDFMAPAIQAAGDRLVAVADPSRDAQAAADRRGARPYATVAALAADPAIEAIYVATPNHLHRVAVEAAAAAGKAVLCEKPIAATLSDAEAAVAACERAGVLYGTAFDQRHHPAHRALKAALLEGRLGTVTAVRIVYGCWLGPDWTSGHDGGDNWRADHAKAGGGALMDLAPHGLDLVDYLLGEPLADITAALQRRVHAYGVDDGAILLGRTASGVLLSQHVAYNCPDALPRRRLEVTGSAGLIVAENTMGQDAGGTLTFIDGGTGRPEPIPVPGIDESPFLHQVRAFDHALRSGDRAAFSGARDLHTMRLLDRAYRGDPRP